MKAKVGVRMKTLGLCSCVGIVLPHTYFAVFFRHIGAVWCMQARTSFVAIVVAVFKNVCIRRDTNVGFRYVSM